MKGLLHRLAERAAGTAKTVRPNVGMSFGEPASAWDEPAEVALQPSSKLVEPTPASPVAMPTPHAPVDRFEPASPAPSARSVQAARDSATSEQGIESQPTADRPQSPLPGADTVVRSDPARSPAPPLPHPTFERLPGAASAPLRSSVETARAPANEPALLMPRAPAETPAPASAGMHDPIRPTPHRAALAAGRQTPSARDNPAEVHIHIGRIDVTAVHEAPAVRRQPAAAPAAMSLDAYLAKR